MIDVLVVTRHGRMQLMCCRSVAIAPVMMLMTVMVTRVATLMALMVGVM